MACPDDNWVRIFQIPDVSKHKKGFTIYKVISMLYPKNCPDSVTKVTVWKRFNDFKKLHRELKAQHKAFKIKDKYPSLPSNLYFKRFDEDVIEQRRANILKFLEFIGLHSKLFTLDVCVQFFKISYTPTEISASNIQCIRAELNLPEESDFDLLRPTSDEERTISDTDSISTLSSMMEHLPDPLTQSTASLKSSKSCSISTSSHDSLCVATAGTSVESSLNMEGQVFPTPPQTPSSLSTAGPAFYILDASQFITQAVDSEVAKRYEEAFAAYKMGIDILLRNVKEDKDFDRKEMVRHKIEKYLLRAEKIYNMHLSPESKMIENYVSKSEIQDTNVSTRQTISDLYKYKVIKIIASGMLVLHSDTQQLFYIKVVHKNSKFSNDKLLLPGNVPYMIKLYNYYNCENALFLILQYSSGTKLSDYIKQRFTHSGDYLSTSFESNVMSFAGADNKEENSDGDSDHSYSDLIFDYTSNRLERSISIAHSSDIDGVTENRKGLSEDNTLTGDGEIETLLAKSQELIFSTEETLKHTIPPIEEMSDLSIKSIKSSRKSSERSEWSSFDDFYMLESSLLPTEDVIKWAAQLLLALEGLHLHGIICCNLQIDNLLIEESGDLILTYKCNISEKYDIAFNNPDLFLAPELYTFLPINEAVDWWSYGAILYELLVGMPLKVVHPEGLRSYTILRIPRYLTVESKSLLKQLLAYEPHERLGNGINGAEDVKSHPFFSTISWDNLMLKYKT